MMIKKEDEIPRGKYFYLDDGRTLKSINELYEKIDSIHDEAFNHYVFNNDFAKWLKGVFGDFEASDNLSCIKSKEDYKRMLKALIEKRKEKIVSGISALKESLSQEAKKAAEVKKIEPKVTLDGIGNNSFAEQVDAFNKKYNEIREGIKNSRKNGKDPYISELNIMNFKAKLHIAEITRKQKDMDIVKNMLLKSEKELNEAESEKVIDVRGEIEEGAKRLIEKEFKEA